jgi:hypothetical protein
MKRLIAYLVAAVLTYGINLASFESIGGDDCRHHAGAAVFFAVFAPVTLPVSFLLSGFAGDGLQFWCSDAGGEGSAR